MKKQVYSVYVLLLENGNYYIGHTNNLNRRMQEHREGRSPYTRRNPLKFLLYSEKFSTRSEAVCRERFLKSGKGREWLRKKLAEQSASGG